MQLAQFYGTSSGSVGFKKSQFFGTSSGSVGFKKSK